MATTKFTDNVTPIIASFMNDVDVATYENLTSVAGTNTITAVGPAGMSAYTNTSFEFIPAVTNTGAVTINITPLGQSALGAVAVTKTGSTPLVAGDLVAGTAYRIIYDGTRYQVLNPTTFNTSQLVSKTSSTGSAIMPNGTTAQRDGSPALAYTRYNTTLSIWEYYNGTSWVPLGGGGATGGGTDQVFYENGQTVTTDYTITTNKNAMSAGPITINTGITVTVPSGSVWTIV